MALYPDVDYKELLDKKYDDVFFTIKHTDESARYLYEALKRGNYIDKSTTLSNFCSIFAKQKRRKPIEWTDNQLKLGYLVHHAFNKPFEKIWVTTVECFSIKGHKPHVEALKSNTAKALRQEREVDPELLEIAERFRELSE